MVQGLETTPGLAGGWNVNHRKQNSGDELQEEDGERGAAEHVPPTGRVARHWMLRDFANGSRKLQAPVEPLADLRNQAHGGFFPTRAALGPGVGSSPAWIVTKPFSILDGYSKRPRSGGPEAREPSR